MAGVKALKTAWRQRLLDPCENPVILGTHRHGEADIYTLKVYTSVRCG